jgi:hypothetical protein
VIRPAPTRPVVGDRRERADQQRDRRERAHCETRGSSAPYGLRGDVVGRQVSG